jgi:hypothetical protein
MNMARCEYTMAEAMESGLQRLGREGMKQIVMAGAQAVVEETKKTIFQYRHVVTGSMMGSVAPGKLHEDIDSTWVDVYPQGDDRRGVSNAKKAFVINYGYGKRRTEKTGDKFITGHKATMQEVASRAMQAESDRLVQQLNGG